MSFLIYRHEAKCIDIVVKEIRSKLPHTISSVDEVGWLIWEDFPSESLPPWFEADNLVGLHFYHSSIERPWRGEKEDVEVHGFNKLSGENLLSPYAKYEVEMAKTGGGLVHIKSCYNNKYFTRWSTHHWWIVAGADEPEEDKSKWSCTLFEILPMDGKIIRFRHVQLGHYACLWRLGSENVYDSCSFAGSKGIDKDQCDMYGNPHLQFSSTDADPATMIKIVATGNGSTMVVEANSGGGGGHQTATDLNVGQPKVSATDYFEARLVAFVPHRL
ncbi:hypothetical protein LguiA_007982 [Lonicera macranthoides]